MIYVNHIAPEIVCYYRILEKTKNKAVDYQYNELNQLTKKKEGNESYSYTTVATLATGIASVSFGLADVLEALQDLSYGLKGSSKASFNPLRDTLSAENEDMYYGAEIVATQAARRVGFQ